jgi:hypothetical protein
LKLNTKWHEEQNIISYIVIKTRQIIETQKNQARKSGNKTSPLHIPNFESNPHPNKKIANDRKDGRPHFA